jgi:hypothetical protein
MPEGSRPPAGAAGGVRASSSASPQGADENGPVEYSLTNILASGKAASASDFTGSFSRVASSPCFRQSLLWAGGVSALLALHRVRQGGGLHKVSRDAFAGWLFTFGTQWYLCRRDEHDRRLVLRAFYQNQQRVRGDMRPVPGPPQTQTQTQTQAGGGAEGASAAASTSESFGAQPPAAVEDWRAEIDRLTSYELPRVERGPAKSVTLR